MEIRSTTFALPDLSAPADRAKQRSRNQGNFSARTEITPAGNRLPTSQLKLQSRSPVEIPGISATAVPTAKRPGNNLFGPEHAPHQQVGIRPGTFSTKSAIATYRQIDNSRFQPAGMELLNRIDARV